MIRAPNFYKIEGVEYQRVTRVTGMIPKQNYLIPWAARITAEVASKMDQSEYQTASIFAEDIKTASAAARVVNRDRGTEIHGAIEAYMADEPVVEKYRGWVDQAQDLLMDYGITPSSEAVETEIVLVNKEVGYAGTCDVRHRKTILDWKTGTRLYPDYLIQMWAYMNATHTYNPHTDVLDKIMVKPTLGILAHLEESDYTVQVLKRNTKLYKFCGETFAHLQGVKRWTDHERKIW